MAQAPPVKNLFMRFVLPCCSVFSASSPRLIFPQSSNRRLKISSRRLLVSLLKLRMLINGLSLEERLQYRTAPRHELAPRHPPVLPTHVAFKFFVNIIR